MNTKFIHITISTENYAIQFKILEDSQILRGITDTIFVPSSLKPSSRTKPSNDTKLLKFKSNNHRLLRGFQDLLCVKFELHPSPSLNKIFFPSYTSICLI